ncbi:MAG: hypothetical protein AAB074_17890 [Planctomycetota bacterium]
MAFFESAPLGDPWGRCCPVLPIVGEIRNRSLTFYAADLNVRSVGQLRSHSFFNRVFDMKRLAIAVLAVVTFAGLCGCGNSKPTEARGGPETGSKSSVPTAGPDFNSQGAEVQAALEEGLAASVSEDRGRFSAWFRAMVIPDYEAWCKRSFGEEKGAKLATSLKSPPNVEEFLRKSFATIHNAGATDVRVVLVTADSDQAPSRDRKVVAGMREKFSLFSASFIQKGESQSTFEWGGFAFVEGRARWIGELSSLE